MGAAVSDSLTAEERQAVDKAQWLDNEIRVGIKAMRSATILLGEYFAQMLDEQLWSLLDHESEEEWLASPGIEFSRSTVKACAQIYRELVEAREVEPKQLEGLDVRKVQMVLPAIRKGEVDIDDALDDCRELGRRDLAARYKKGKPGDPLAAETEPVMTRCENCGSWVEADKIDEKAGE